MDRRKEQDILQVLELAGLAGINQANTWVYGKVLVVLKTSVSLISSPIFPVLACLSSLKPVLSTRMELG